MKANSAVRIVVALILLCICPAFAVNLTYYWSADGTSAGGTGTWDTNTVHFGGALAGPFIHAWTNAAFGSDYAQFSGTAGTVTVAPYGVNARRVIVTVSGYTLTGGKITSDAPNNTFVIDKSAANAVTISNNFDLTLAGSGNVRIRNSGGLANPLTLAGTYQFTDGSGIKFLDLDGVGVSGSRIDFTGSLLQTPGATIRLRIGHNGGTGATNASLYYLSGSSTYSGGTHIVKGTVHATHAGALGLGGVQLATSTTTAGNTVQLFLVGALNITNAVSLSTATAAASGVVTAVVGKTTGDASSAIFNGTVNLNSDTTHLELQVADAAAQLQFTGLITDGAGTRGLTKTGDGAVLLTGVSTYDGPTTINAGRVIVTTTGASSNSTFIVNVNGGLAFTNNVSFTLGGLAGSGNLGLTNLAGTTITLSVGNNNSDTTYSGVLSGGGRLTKLGTGTLTLANSNTFSGLTTILTGRLILGHTNSVQNSTVSNLVHGGLLFSGFTRYNIGALAGTGDIGLTNLAGAGIALLVGTNNANSTYSGVLSGSGSLTKRGGGRFVLAGQNSYTGNTTIDSGTIVAGANWIFTNTALTVHTAATFSNNFHQSVRSISGSGTIHIGTGGSLSNGFDNTSTTFGGRIVGGGLLAKYGTGMLTLSGTNTYSGGTVLQSGTLRFLTPDAFPGYALTINGGILDPNGNTLTVTTLNGTGGVISNGGLIVTGGGTYAGNITHNGPLTNSSGTLILTGTNTYSGGTAIIGGTLRVDGMIAGAGTVTVGSAGTLSGSGVLSGKVTNAGMVFANSSTPLRLFGPYLINEVSGVVTAHNGGLTVAGVFTNAGTLVMMHSVGTFHSAVVNSGAWIVDPTTNIFANTYTLTGSGSISMTAGDVFIFTNGPSTVGSFINNSTQSNTTSMLAGKFLFSSTLSLTQQFATAGNNIGNLDTDGGTNTVVVSTLNPAALAQYSNNFAVGTLELAGNTTLMIYDSFLVGGRSHGGLQAALFLDTLNLSPGATLIISNNVQVYFINSNGFSHAQVQLLGNGGLHQLVLLDPVMIPEPSTVLLWLTGLAVWAARRRNQRSCNQLHKRAPDTPNRLV